MQIRRKFNLIRNIVYVLFLLISLTCIMFLYNDYSAQIPLKVIFYVLLIQFVAFQISARRMRISLVNRKEINVYRDGTADLALFINKRSIYPFKNAEIIIKYRSRYEGIYRRKILKIELKDGLKQWEKVEVTGLCCGYNDFVIESIFLYDAFSFTSIRLKCRYKPLSMIIVPEIKPVIADISKAAHIPVDEMEAFTDDNRGKSNEDLYEIREFRDGDSLNKIHWKLSSKQNELMVREGTTLIDTNIYVFFDLCKSVDINRMFEDAVSISYELLNMGYTFYISWLEEDSCYNKPVFRRTLVTKYEQIDESLLKLMEYPLYERDAENIYILQKFMNEQTEVCNLFII